MKEIRFIDLFSGIGGIRLGFENACKKFGLDSECVLTSEIKPYAREVLRLNHPNDEIAGDIREVRTSDIPDFDFLLGGFPCQAFSTAGKRLGFQDTRGTLFFEIERILKDKKPFGFVLENVDGLVIHDKENPKDKIGRTLKTILSHLESLGYGISWRVLNASDFGVPQNRRRIYIVGTRNGAPNLEDFPICRKMLGEVLESGVAGEDSPFIRKVLSRYSASELIGKSFNDKRGGESNIHSWDLDLKGETSKEQRNLLSAMLKERRRKMRAGEAGIVWKDGMPLSMNQIRTFFDSEELPEMLDNLVGKRYLKVKEISDGVYGYDICSGKMSFEVNEVLNPSGIAPTLVATDMDRLFVEDNGNLRRLTLREGLRLFGYPEDFRFDISRNDGYDLLGNTVVVPVIEGVAGRLLEIFVKESDCLNG